MTRRKSVRTRIRGCASAAVLVLTATTGASPGEPPVEPPVETPVETPGTPGARSAGGLTDTTTGDRNDAIATNTTRGAAANASRVLVDVPHLAEPMTRPALPEPAEAPMEPPPAAPTLSASAASAVAGAAGSLGPGSTVEMPPGEVGVAMIETSRAASETQGLGRPNGPLNARPAVEGETASFLDDPLAAFDPRVSEIARVGGALVVVLGLMLLIKFGLGRAAGGLGGGKRPAGVLEILARYPVARGQSLLILKMGRRLVLVHQTATGMQTLSEVTDHDEVAALLGRMEAGSRARDAGRFQTALSAFEEEHARLAAPEAATRDARGVEIVDLTRRRRRPLGWILGRRAVA